MFREQFCISFVLLAIVAIKRSSDHCRTGGWWVAGLDCSVDIPSCLLILSPAAVLDRRTPGPVLLLLRAPLVTTQPRHRFRLLTSVQTVVCVVSRCVASHGGWSHITTSCLTGLLVLVKKKARGQKKRTPFNQQRKP